MKSTFNTVLPFAAGAAVGGLSSAVSWYQAQAAVEVRPKLADVSFIDALLTNHGIDWLFYHFPLIGTVITVLLMSTIIGVMWNYS